MINITNKFDCCGCNACGDICPTDAITFPIDIEGFWYPKVNLDKCINCGLCEKTCPNIHISTLKKNDYDRPAKVVAAINKNLAVRWDSTSGGAFSALAQEMYNRGGYVSGAVYTEDFHVKNFISNNPEDLTELRSSKYLESYAKGLYKEIKSLLKKGEKGLACGTPCQMAGLRAFLGKDYDNLIIVDFICRGVNSPKVYRSYLDSLEKQYGSKVVKVKAKNKELGWRNLTRKVTFENGESYYGVLMEDDFRRGYHTNVYCRPSCYECVFKGFPRMSDITLADFWGIEKYNKNLDNNIGTSLIILNSKKGERYFDEVKDRFEYSFLPIESSFKGNIALHKPIEQPTINRESFFKDLDENNFDFVVNKYFPKNQVNSKSLKQKIKSIIKPYYLLVKQERLSLSSYIKFFKINYRKHTTSDFRQGNVIYPKPGVVFDLHPTAKINITYPLVYGNNPVKGLHLPSCLRMEANTEFTVLEGHRDRYGEVPYNLRYGAYIEIVNGGKLVISRGASNVGLTIMCAKEITIGSGVRIGRNVSIRDWNGPHVIVSDTYKNHAPVHIGNKVWLCTGCSIMPGVTIGDGAVVAANSTVTKDVPPRTLVGGSPAKVIKENIEWY